MLEAVKLNAGLVEVVGVERFDSLQDPKMVGRMGVVIVQIPRCSMLVRLWGTAD